MYLSIVFNVTLLSEFAAIFTDSKGAGGRAGAGGKDKSKKSKKEATD